MPTNILFKSEVVNLIDAIADGMIAALDACTVTDDSLALYRAGIQDYASALRKALGTGLDDDDAARDDGEDEATERFLHPERYRKGD